MKKRRSNMFSTCFDKPSARFDQLNARSFFIFNSSFLIFSFFIFHSSFVHTQIPTYVPTNGLVGYWPFNGNANDESGNGNNGVVNGATLTTDRFGVANKAYSFGSSHQGIQVNQNVFGVNTGNLSFSISFWVLRNMNVNTTMEIITNRLNLSDQYNFRFQLGALNSTYHYNFASYNNVGNLSSVQSNLALTQNWENIVLIGDIIQNKMIIFINGQQIAVTNNIQSPNLNTPLSIAYVNAVDPPFQGKLDDIAIYNRALTQQEITNLYTGSAPPSITTSASTSIINCGESASLTASSVSAVQPCVKAELPATLQNGLVGYWPFCGNANDASGNNNNGTVNGAALTTDRFGNPNSAYSFDGLSNYIQVNSSSSLNFVNSLSIGAWVYNTNIISGERTIISRERFSGGACSYRIATTSTAYAFGINNEPSSGGCGQACNLGVLGNNSVISGIWQYVVGVWDGVTCKIYVNGILVNTANAVFPNGNTLINSTMPIFIGKWMSVFDPGLQGFQYFNGKLDDITIHNRALFASEIQQLYSLGNVSYSWSTGATTPSITVTPAVTSTFNCTATNSAGSTTSSVTVTVADTLTWIGAVDTDWHKACNWSPQFVPKCCNNVSVPVTTNQPIVSGVAAAEDLTIFTTNGAQVTVNNGANLQIADCPATVTTAACPSFAVLTTTAVSSITQTTAVSGGTITYPGASTITARGICWSTSVNPTLANSFTSNGTGIGTFTSNLSGLTAGTTYYVRAYATNGSGTSYGNQVSFVAVNPQPAYPSNSVFCASGPTLVVDVTNPTTGKTWMDRNLGASRTALSSTDVLAYGDLYQWGRRPDGHQCRNSATTTGLSNFDQPTHGFFILSPNVPADWRAIQNDNLWQGVNGINNPCPIGYRIPTVVEIDAERVTWSSQNSAGAFSSPLKITVAGLRMDNDGSLNSVGVNGYYWLSTVLGYNSRSFQLQSNFAGFGTASRALGMSVRCIKN